MAGKPLTIGRSADNALVLEHGRVSREHAEVVLRMHSQPADIAVLLVDLGSKHGTAHRRLKLEHGAEVAVGHLNLVPRLPAGPVRLKPGDHDVLLAGEVWVRVGGVSIDHAATDDDDDAIPRPTRREHDVLVELCRPQYEGRDVAVPSNGTIGSRLVPPIGADRVSDLLSQLYAKYELHGTKEQNRIELIHLAINHRFVRPEDYA